MAEAEDIQAVLDNIESDYTAHGWTEAEIEARLENGAIWQRVVYAYWNMRANQTILLVNTSEAGSSRGMDAVYSRIRALADSWDTKAGLIETPPTTVGASARLRSFPIRRV